MRAIETQYADHLEESAAWLAHHCVGAPAAALLEINPEAPLRFSSISQALAPSLDRSTDLIPAKIIEHVMVAIIEDPESLSAEPAWS